jgi:hypothetical protein
MGCDDPAGNGDAEGGDDPGDELTCETLDANAIEDGCGTFTDGADEASRAALVTCVTEAAAEGRSFSVSYGYYANDGQYDTTRAYFVTADGMMWDEYTGFSDLCTVDETTLHGRVDLDALAACDAWSCIESALESAEFVAECVNETNCDGV